MDKSAEHDKPLDESANQTELTEEIGAAYRPDLEPLGQPFDDHGHALAPAHAHRFESDRFVGAL
jgi:hypothetical protein